MLYCIVRMSAALPVDYCEVCRMYCIVLSGCLPRCLWTTVRCVGCIVLYCQDVCRAASGLL